MIKPIPKRMLPHKCIYQEYLGNNGEGDEWGTEIPLEYVKIEEKLQLRVTSNGREVIGNGRLFYDYVNSKGLPHKFTQNDIIIFDNKRYSVIESSSLYANSPIPHHYEVILK